MSDDLWVSCPFCGMDVNASTTTDHVVRVTTEDDGPFPTVEECNATPAVARPVGYAARCLSCQEDFNPATPHDLIHLQRLSGEECGGQGELLGEWR